MRKRLVPALILCAIVLALGPAPAMTSSIPGIPGLPPLNQAAKDVVSKAIVKQMGDEFNLDEPLRVDADAEYPTTPTLPGGAFRPVGQHVIESLYAHATGGRPVFPPGDYSVPVFAYCMLAHTHVPMRNKFVLSPIQGKWADIAGALFSRTSYGYDPRDVQVLTWSMLAGLKYQELPPRAQRLVDAVLPDFKSRMQESFYETLQRRWAQLSSNVPGVPSFDNALTKMGDVGKEILALRDLRNELINNAANYDQIEVDLASIGVPRVPSGKPPTPWSIVQPGVYARFLDTAGFMNPGVLQIRVTRQIVAAHAGRIVAHPGRGGSRDVTVVADPFGWPIPNFGGYPGSAVQALGWSPQPGNAPGGTGAGGGAPKPGSAPGQIPPPPKPGQAPAPPTSQPSPEDGSGDGSGGGSSGAGSSGSNGGDDEGDASSPCDPPGNIFGVDHGKLVSDSASGIVVAKTPGTGKDASQGIVCLLLRPFVSMAPLGWPQRGSGTVDDGSAGYALFGQSHPGHVVITAHYTYATTSDGTHLYIKKHVTAVIDYAPVTPFCSEIQQTTGPRFGSQLGPGWLSGAELENRLCIAGMTGGSIHINAWVVDGDFTGLRSQARQVDPNNFLYSDAWNHM